MCRRSAARPKCRSSASTANDRRCRSSMRSTYQSSQIQYWTRSLGPAYGGAHELRVPLRRGPHAVRPVRRRPRRACAPTTWPPIALHGRPRQGARTSTRPRSATSSGAAPTRPARTTATSAGWRCCSPGCRSRCRPPPSTGSAARPWTPRSPGSRTIESGDADVVVAGGVESMTRAPWVLPKPSRAFPAGNVTAVSTTLGWRLVNERMPAEWTVSLGEANELLRREVLDLARAPGRVRRPLAQAAPPRPGTPASTTTWWSRSPASTSTRDEGIRPGSTAEKLAGLKPSFRAGRHDHRRQRLAAQRRRLRRAARLRGAPADRHRPDRPDRRARGVRAGRRRCSASRRSRPRTGRWPAPASAGPTSARSSSTRRSPCSRWPASTPGERSTPRSSTPRAARSRSATRSAPPAAGSSAPSPTGCGSRGERWGVAAICIGVGQALAVVLENVA